MTTDPFIEAARAEAGRRWPRMLKQSGNTLRLGQCFGFVVGAEWARTHLAAHDARVRRDAAREALDELIAWHRANAQDTETPAPIRRGIAVMAGEAQRFRDTHYPETED